MNNKKGFISVVALLIFSGLFIMIMFVGYQYTIAIEIKQKMINVSDEVAEISAFRLEESSLSNGILEFDEIRVRQQVEDILKDTFFLNDDLTPLSYSTLKETPTIIISYFDNPSVMGVPYSLPEGYEFTPETSSIVVQVEYTADLLFFTRDLNVQTVAIAEVDFKKSTEGLSIVLNPQTEEDILLTLEGVVNPYRFSGSFFPLMWDFSPLPLASGGKINFSAKFKDENFIPNNVTGTVKVEGVKEDGSMYLNVFDIPMYSVINGRNLITSTYPTPDASISVYKITNPYSFDIPVNWINISSLGSSTGKLIASASGDTFFEVPESIILITYTHGKLLTNGISFGNTTIETPRDYIAVDNNGGSFIDSGLLVSSQFIVPDDAPDGSVVSIWINSDGKDVNGTELTYQMPSRVIGVTEHNMKDIIILN